MLTTLRLKNFKAWRDTREIALKPVTTLLGTNSSGKSSLIQSLLLLKQTVQSPDRTIHLNLGGDEVNDYFNFGDFDSVVTHGTISPRFFGLEFSFKRKADERIRQGQFHCTYAQITGGGVAVRNLRISNGKFQFRLGRSERGAYALSVEANGETQSFGKVRDFAPERSIALPATAIAALGVDGFMAEDLSLAIRRELEGIIYLGPLRRKPERDYVWNKSKPGEIGSDGHKVIDVLLASALLRGNGHGDLIEGVSNWLVRMKVADKLEVRQVGRSSRYEVVVHRDGVAANLRDVGIGISQVLPVLTVAHFAPPGSTVLLEEPEIHLHPLAQAVLAELFVELSQQRGVQFIVETHSEHLFRRMQTLIAQGKAKLDDCAMYFVAREEADAVLQELNVDEFGVVKNWPVNFFGDAVGEARAQAQARAERMKGVRHG